MSDANGRIKLTWPQLAWGLTLLATVIGSWFSIQARIDRTTAALDGYDRRLERLEARLESARGQVVTESRATRGQIEDQTESLQRDLGYLGTKMRQQERELNELREELKRRDAERKQSLGPKPRRR